MASTAPASSSSTRSSLGLLKNRLLVEDLIARHPEILDEGITAPIVICGLPRTGTTHLHNLISADPALRSLPYWESLEPVLPSASGPPPEHRTRGRNGRPLALSFLDVAMPYFNRMHEMTVDHAHEEIQLLAIDFSSMLFETTAPMPTVARRLPGPRPAPELRLPAARPPGAPVAARRDPLGAQVPPAPRAVPGALLETFPDATFVVTHRDPVSVTTSMVTMLAYSARLTRDRVDVEGIGQLLGRPPRAHAAPLRRGARRPSGRADHRRPLRRVHGRRPGHGGRVYDLAAQPFGPTPAPPCAASWPPTRGASSAPIEYDLAQFDLDPRELRQAFAFYTERFTVTPET